MMPAHFARLEQGAAVPAFLRRSCVVLEGTQRVVASSDEESAGAQPSGGLPGLPLETRQEVEQVLDGSVAVRDRLPGDVAGGMPGRAGAEPVALQQDHLTQPAFRHVPGDAGADDATADDQDPSHAARVRDASAEPRKGRRHHPSAVTGSIILRTSVTTEAGNPLRSACSWMSASSSAR